MAAHVQVSEIFFSLQGEASRSGLPTVFVRLTGCPLRCVWCDTAYAFTGGQAMSVAAVLEAVRAFPARQVCVTGGEPLAQSACRPLLTALCDAGFEVSLETSGALSLENIDARVARIMDLKAPDSGEASRNLWDNLALLNERDEIKLVIASRGDYDWARDILRERQLDKVCPILMSPAQGLVEPTHLAEWILADGLPVRFQLQLHKLLWGSQRGK